MPDVDAVAPETVALHKPGLEVERRSLASFETRAEKTASGKKRISGYGSLYDVEQVIEGWFADWTEVVAKGAWARTIAESDRIVSTHNHNLDNLLGATDSGTLELVDDDTGLFYEVDVNEDDPYAMAVWARVKRGDVKGASVWFRVLKQEIDDTDEDNPKRTILDADLFEVGPVVMPAFESTTAEAASREVGRRGLVIPADSPMARLRDENVRLRRLVDGFMRCR